MQARRQMEGQTRLELPSAKGDCYMDFTIWQPSTKCRPWAVHVEGWKLQGVDVWIYHEGLKNGYHYYPNLVFKSIERFAGFVRSQIVAMRNVFKIDIEIRGIDYRAIAEGYEKGEKRAGSIHIHNDSF